MSVQPALGDFQFQKKSFGLLPTGRMYRSRRQAVMSLKRFVDVLPYYFVRLTVRRRIGRETGVRQSVEPALKMMLKSGERKIPTKAGLV